MQKILMFLVFGMDFYLDKFMKYMQRLLDFFFIEVHKSLHIFITFSLIFYLQNYYIYIFKLS